MPESIVLDSRWFAPESVSAETASFNAQVEEMLAKAPPLHEQTPEQVRAARELGQGTFGPVIRSDLATERTVPGPAGDVPVRLLIPDTVKGVYLHIHGGGWVLGRAEEQDARNEQIARDCQVAVVSVDYRLAPEHPYPAGPDDCEAVALWLAEHAKAEFGSDRLIIGGESAGAHLAVVTLVRLRSRHDFTGFAAANLVYGVYDLAQTPSAANWGERNLILSTPLIHWFADHFVPPAKRRDPDVSPLYADLRRLPRALFTVGTLDSLLDDTLFMSARWVAAGNAAELAVYPGGSHAFDRFPIEIARQATARIDDFIRQAVAE